MHALLPVKERDAPHACVFSTDRENGAFSILDAAQEQKKKMALNMLFTKTTGFFFQLNIYDIDGVITMN